ncbi:foldase protein PrsA [Salirhabdus euzebyi]|uniref:Foldase protein PrsA n=1 Tax=Salirhabdus euzebyi TaxID=394506 RepID=A0A841Q8D7_9BACI|nr:peptidylprolyl isomerase [Salirhabdus euzebyi]MBB6454666.1 foldase protein PrsA [Salirhabdus euzebyi]
MKKFIIALVLATSVLALTGCTSGDDSDPVVETEAGNITKEEFYQQLKERHGEEILQEMVITKVLSDKYDVSDEEIDKEVESIKEQYGDQFEMALMQSGYATEDQLRNALRFNKLQELAVIEDIEVSDEAIQKQYDRMTYEVRASHILVEDEETAKDLVQQLAEGADFASLAEEHSIDEASAVQGGDVDFFGIDANMVTEFKDAAYELEVGEVSEPVQSQFGWHIIKLTDTRDVEDVKPLEDLREEIKTSLAQEQIDPQKAQEKIQQLLDDAKIDIKIDQFKDLFKTTEQ